MTERYDTIGQGYALRRSPDPRIAAAILAALGDSRVVANIGAGTGSYEPRDRQVIAIEPSTVMIAQRPAGRVAARRGYAEAIPLADRSVDACLAILTMHHWHDWRAGVAEMRRVARERIVVLTVDVAVSSNMWLFDEYLPFEVTDRDRAEFPGIDELRGALGTATTTTAVPVPADCRDGFLLSFWSQPERVLDPGARQATSGFARLSAEQEESVVAALTADLSSGAWDLRHGHLRELTEMDVGLRLLVAGS